jgi:hypothetical protein
MLTLDIGFEVRKGFRAEKLVESWMEPVAQGPLKGGEPGQDLPTGPAT